MSLYQVDGLWKKFVVGCYILPTDLTTLARVLAALWQIPDNCKPLLLGNLNVKFKSLYEDEREIQIAEEMDVIGLSDMS